MARKRPVRIWIIRHSPRREPKFHQMERFLGAGRSTKALFMIDRTGWDFRIGWDILRSL